MYANKKIKVLQTIHQGKVGGGERHILDLVNHLDRSRFEPTVLSFTEGPMVDTLKRMRIPVEVIHSEKAFDFRVWGKVRRFLEEEQVDIIHVHGTRANTNILPISWKLQLPVIYTVHGWSFHHGLSLPIHKARQLAEKWITSRTALNIAVSESNRQTGIDSFGKFRSVVIRNGVNLERFNPAAASDHLRAQYGFAADDIVVGFIARMTEQKDPLGLIRAFAMAVQQQPRLKLLMVGDGSLKAEAIKLVQQLGITANVVLDSFRSDIPDVLQAIDIYCLPSLWEGYPIGVLEAMAMGKTVIATDVDGTREALENEVSGLLIPPADKTALCESLRRVAADKGFRDKLSFAALQQARIEHSITAMTAKIEDIYNNIFVQQEMVK
ncbi:MAG: glycosyltransferase [Chitinophaga sp.]|uniref:glycosyltransferase n=1 Tax=Chitinophaga sp. TaxID=1869181 RepID=UPI0025C3A1FF|nr:glycosyltransferase [Chitinophaga sp.]MBV8253779.1 glycosyltransferase [Chitinophaga sp.]